MLNLLHTHGWHFDLVQELKEELIQLVSSKLEQEGTQAKQELQKLLQLEHELKEVKDHVIDMKKMETGEDQQVSQWRYWFGELLTSMTVDSWVYNIPTNYEHLMRKCNNSQS